jgi:hypothetical protein
MNLRVWQALALVLALVVGAASQAAPSPLPPASCVRFYGYTSGNDAATYVPLTDTLYSSTVDPCNKNSSCTSFTTPNGCVYTKRGAAAGCPSSCAPERYTVVRWRP